MCYCESSSQQEKSLLDMICGKAKANTIDHKDTDLQLSTVSAHRTMDTVREWDKAFHVFTCMTLNMKKIETLLLRLPDG